jgi:photosystem II stability/assembly factor-like uncharacterized protein
VRRPNVGRVATIVVTTIVAAGLLAACSGTTASTTTSTTGGLALAKVGPLDSVSCASTSDCVAIGYGAKPGTSYSTADAGSSWSRSALPASFFSILDSVWCPSKSDCVVVGAPEGTSRSGAAYTTDGGASWTPGQLPPGFVALGLSCPSTRDCVTVGLRKTSSNTATRQAGTQRASIAYTSDGGASWSAVVFPSVWFNVDAVSCASTSHCVALGYINDDARDSIGAAFSTDGGRSWTQGALPAGFSDPQSGGASAAVSCPTTSDCVAVVNQEVTGRYDVGVAFTADGGSSWSEGTLPLGLAGLQDVSCLSRTDCVAVGGAGAEGTRTVAAALFTTDGGATWSAAQVPTGLRPFWSVSCRSHSDCTAVGFLGGSPALVPAAFTTDGGKSWT